MQFVPEMKYGKLHCLTHMDPWRYSVARHPVDVVDVDPVPVPVPVLVLEPLDVIVISMQVPEEEMIAVEVLQQKVFWIKDCPELQLATHCPLSMLGNASGQVSTHVLFGPKNDPAGHEE